MLIPVAVLSSIPAAGQTPQTEDELQAARQRAVDQKRLRLEKAIENDGFFSARVALNLWKREAQNAGLFDQNAFDHYKRKLYTISVDRNNSCFEYFLQTGHLGNAEACLKIWRLHSLEIDLFDPAEYDAKIETLRQAQESAAQKKAAQRSSRKE